MTSSMPAAHALPLVIVNLASRGGTGATNWPHAASALRSHFGPFECRFTESRGHATTLAREAGQQGRTLVVTFGGDGTVSEAARGLLASGQRCALGILPHGTGGDLARSLGLPTRVGDAARVLGAGRTVAVDVGRVVLSNKEERYFVNAASFGLSADVAARVNRPRSAGYLEETVRAAIAFRPPCVELALDGRSPRSVSITTVSVHNGRYFGGGMEMAPEANLEDGRLELVVVKKLSLPRLLPRAPLLYWGAHQGLAEVEHRKVQKLEARSTDGPIDLEIDGETGYRLPASFEVEPARLHVRVGVLK